MPRKARLHIPGIFQHVMARGIEGRSIFAADEDRIFFLKVLAKELKRSGFRCYAWVLMKNHYHLLLRTNEESLGSMMRRLNSSYARYYGTKHKRKGYLFQDRFKSVATQDQRYVEEIIRYVHLNPIRAGVCRSIAELDRYRWSGHSAIMGNRSGEFQDTKAILLRFSGKPVLARDKYHLFISEGLKNKAADELIETIRRNNSGFVDIHNSGSWVIGDPEFVRHALQADKARRIRIARYRTVGWDLERLAVFVQQKMNVDREQLMRKSKRTIGAEARKVFCFLGYRVLGFPATLISRFLDISVPAVSYAVRNAESIIKKRKIELNI